MKFPHVFEILTILDGEKVFCKKNEKIAKKMLDPLDLCRILCYNVKQLNILCEAFRKWWNSTAEGVTLSGVRKDED